MPQTGLIRFFTTLAQAKHVEESPISKIFYNWSVRMLPDEAYCVITNVEDGMSFDDDILAEIVDCSGTILKDITQNTFVSEFTSTIDGTQQCVIEFVNLDFNRYGKACHIKLSKYTSDSVWYSTPITINDDDSNEVCTVDFWSEVAYRGIDYPTAGAKQRIGVRMYRTRPDNKIEQGSYMQFTRENEIGLNAQIYKGWEFVIPQVTGFVWEGFQEAFAHPIFYIDGIRSMNILTSMELGDMIGQTNTYDGNFRAAQDKSDLYTYQYQIFQELQALRFYPPNNSSFTTDSIVTYLGALPILGGYARVEFNRNITDTGNITAQVYKDGVLFFDFVETENYVVEDNAIGLFIDTGAGVLASNGQWSFFISAGAGTDQFGNLTPEISLGSWIVNIGEADYDSEDYNSNDYFTD